MLGFRTGPNESNIARQGQSRRGSHFKTGGVNITASSSIIQGLLFTGANCSHAVYNLIIVTVGFTGAPRTELSDRPPHRGPRPLLRLFRTVCGYFYLWVLIRPGLEPTTSRAVVRRSTNWANRSAVIQEDVRRIHMLILGIKESQTLRADYLNKVYTAFMKVVV